MQKKSFALKCLPFFFFCVLAPALVVLGYRYLDSRYYYVSALGLIVLSLSLFFFTFEKRKLKTTEVVCIAVMAALCAASRVAFGFIPQVKPMCALVIITAISFGGSVGFVVGALSVFVSNFTFGQGMFTPFQMLGMGLTGFFCALFFFDRPKMTNRVSVSAIGGVLTFAVYGFIVDTCSVFMMASDYSFKSVLAVYLSGAPFNLVHAVTTAAVLFLFFKPMSDKLSRLHTKYGIFSEENI